MKWEESDRWAPVVRGQWGTWRVALERQPMSAAGLASVYDALAPTWAAQRAAWGFDGVYRSLLGVEGGLPIAGALRRGPVLDLGCGDGGFAAACVAVHGPQPVVLVDASPRMLAVASERLTREGCPVVAHHAFARSLPLATGSVGVVLAGHVLEHLADPVPALTELRRVLAPGGVLVVVATRGGLVGRLLQLRWRLRCHTAAEARRALSSAGFVADVKELTGSWLACCASLAWVGTVPEDRASPSVLSTG